MIAVERPYCFRFRHSHGGTGCGSTRRPRFASRAAISSSSSTASPGAYLPPNQAPLSPLLCSPSIGSFAPENLPLCLIQTETRTSETSKTVGGTMKPRYSPRAVEGSVVFTVNGFTADEGQVLDRTAPGYLINRPVSPLPFIVTRTSRKGL